MSEPNRSVAVQSSMPSYFDSATNCRVRGASIAPVGAFARSEILERDAHASSGGSPERSKPEQWSGLQARMALDPLTRADAFRLRHLCYASKGYIDARENGLFSDEHDFDDGNTTLVIYDEAEAVGSVRVCTMAAATAPGCVRDLPVAHVFPDEMNALLAPCTKAVEINRLVSHPEHAHNLGLVFVLMRLAGYVIGEYNPDFVTSCVRANHVPFYKRLQFENVAGPRLYTGLKFMTNFMVARQDRYDVVRQTVPGLNLSRHVVAKYEALWNGEQVSVFDNG